uniref:Uncharacterized protein n=1 Tax=Morchella brunnea TaxID=1174671 RepID=A0A8K1I8E1_9PEZI|nr:hypothetical protein LK370_mgp066 [Morchella brunnea]UBU98574.1 hypothetical protein [Morchella brunnea]
MPYIASGIASSNEFGPLSSHSFPSVPPLPEEGGGMHRARYARATLCWEMNVGEPQFTPNMSPLHPSSIEDRMKGRARIFFFLGGGGRPGTFSFYFFFLIKKEKGFIWTICSQAYIK